MLTAQQQSNGGKAAAAQKKADKAELLRLRELFRNQGQPKPEQQAAEQTEAYIAARLNRVRKQIEALSDMLEAEEDPNKLDRLANAISRMSELERQLAGRPLPGSLKPSQPRQQQRSTVQPIGPAPVAPVLPESNKPS